MKKMISVVVSLVMLFSVMTTTVSAASDNQALELKKELIQLNQKYKEYFTKEHIHVVMGNIYATSPQFIVDGYGFGTEGFMQNAKYYVIDDPNHGETRLYFYQGLHSYLGMTTIQDKYGNTQPAMHFSSVSDECYKVRAELYAKEAQYQELTGEKINYEYEMQNVLNQYADYNVIAFQIGNPEMNAYRTLQKIDEFGTAPALIDNATYLPIRSLVEASDGMVEWDDETKSATMTLNGRVVTVTLNSDTGMVNGQMVQMNHPVKLVNGKTMVPLRFIGDSFKMEVEWVNDEKVIVVRYQRDAGAHLDDLITDVGNGFKEFNFADIAKFKYPARWGTPEMNTERAVFYVKNNTIYPQQAYITVEKKDQVINIYGGESLEVDEGGSEWTVPLTEENTGVKTIIFRDRSMNGVRDGWVDIVGENGYWFQITWSDAEAGGRILPVKDEVLELIKTFSVEEAAG